MVAAISLMAQIKKIFSGFLKAFLHLGDCHIAAATKWLATKHFHTSHIFPRVLCSLHNIRNKTIEFESKSYRRKQFFLAISLSFQVLISIHPQIQKFLELLIFIAL